MANEQVRLLARGVQSLLSIRQSGRTKIIKQEAIQRQIHEQEIDHRNEHRPIRS
jgi:hypothetical protein